MNCPATENLIKHIAEFPKIKRIYYDAPEHQEFLTALLMACKAALPELRGLVMNREEKKPGVEIVLPTRPQTFTEGPPQIQRLTKDELNKLAMPQTVHEVDLTPMPDPWPTVQAPPHTLTSPTSITPAVATARAASKRGKR